MRKKTEKSENAETFDLADNSAISSILEKLGGVVRMDDVLDRLNKALAELGHINLIIAGKSGVGKSTLINSVFRQDVADTGVGKPFTKEMTLYEREDVPLRIYDTKGLELGADAQAETINGINALVQNQRSIGDERQYIHCIWYCFNAGSTRVENFELDFIRKLSSDVPVIVVITRGSRAKDIIKGYKQRKFDAEAIKEVVDNELSAVPQYQGCYIVLAKDEDGERAFGLEELTKATARLIPGKAQKAFINAQKVLIDQKVQASNMIINNYTVSAAAIGAVPIPFSDAPFLAAAELAMCAHITATFGIDLDKAVIANLVVSMAGVSGVTVAGKFVVSNLLKIFAGSGSVVGGIVSGTTAAILIEALGRTYVAILKMIAEGEKKEDDLTNKSFESEIKKMMKKQLKDVIASLKKHAKSISEGDASQTSEFSEKSTEILQGLADVTQEL